MAGHERHPPSQPGSEEALVSLALAIDPSRAQRVLADLERFGNAPPAASGGAQAPPGRAVLLATAYEGLAGAVMRAPNAVPLPRPYAREELENELASSIAASADTSATLRQFARTHRLRIALRELLPTSLGGADLEETAAELSVLADVTIQAALDEATRFVCGKIGWPASTDGEEERRSTLVVFGMGKLGGNELNGGSDVDLVCFYDSDEHTAGVHSAHEVWTRVVRRMTASLADVTEEGFVWRVDHRLRPEGSRGPLVNSVAAAERYYETFGRLWERATWIRARPVAGDLSLGQEVLAVLRPFVWRRRVVPSIAVSMYELVHRARAELSAAPERDLKLGPGGIREAEFFVQSLQLIWGGTEPRLRACSTLDATQRLLALGLITEQEATDLSLAYVALRRAEHAVQWSSGIQTHSLPRGAVALERIARSLGFSDTHAFVADLEAQQERVSALFRSLSPSGALSTSRWNDALLALDHDDYEAFSAALVSANMPGADDHQHGQLVRDLYETARFHPEGVLGTLTRDRRRHLPDNLLEAIAGSADPTQAARHLRGFCMRVAPPEIYTTLLSDDPAAVRRLITVLGGSAFVGSLVASRPELADLVLFEHRVPSEDDARLEVLTAWRGLPPDSDLEESVGPMRRAQARVLTQVALADLAGELDTRETTSVLSAMADEALECAARVAMGATEVTGLAILAMGKLGGKEIGYGSDLDVIFLFDPDAAPAGKDPFGHFTKLARRIIQIITMRHPDGPAYELDTRLRPSGSQGMLVVSLPAFARYHEHDADSTAPSSRRAATWERLALLRARFAAGDARIGELAMEVVHRAAHCGAEAFDVGEVARDVHRLRCRMERELARERPGRYDVKLGRGGLIEVEFATQLLQLQHGHHPSVASTHTLDALIALAALEVAPPQHLDALREGCEFLRRLQQRLRVVHGDGIHLIEERAAGMRPLARRMGIRDAEGRDAAHQLLERYRSVTGQVREAYEAIVVTPFHSSGDLRHAASELEDADDGSDQRRER